MSDDHPIHALSRRYVDAWAAAKPDAATIAGLTGHEADVTDYSPEARNERVAMIRDTLTSLDKMPVAEGADRVAVDFHRERLSSAIELADSGEDIRALSVLGSPVQTTRMVFDVLPKTSAEDWEVIASRLEGVVAATDGVRALLDEGRSRDILSSRRQAEACLSQCRSWSGDGDGFFASMVDGAEVDDALSARLDAAAELASDAYRSLGDYLRDVYLPDAPDIDGVGMDRYRMLARGHLGADIDPVETYEWGWEEFRRIEAEMVETAGRIVPGAGISEVIEHLEAHPAYTIDDEQHLRAWLQDRMDRIIEELDGTHFDIPEPVKAVEAMIAPSGGAAAMYYTPPSEDFIRPGRTWYPTLGRTRFPLWGELSICYHEGVPGHHLQIAQVTYLGEVLTALQRLEFVPGHGEGWALYSERLMDELGYFDDPVYRLGYLRAQVMRAMRIIVDIGMHLGLPIPSDSDFAPGEIWNPALGQQFANERSRFPAEFMSSEVSRYLGLPAQAISYKVGERVWLEGRADAQRRLGPSFDLKAFHGAALDLGHLGLDQLRAELGRIG